MDKSKQIENLLGSCDWFVLESKVIRTTRDGHLVANHGKVCSSYEVKELDKHEALELFSQHAFHGNKPKEDYLELASHVTIIGSDLCGRTKFEWKNAIDKYKKNSQRRYSRDT